MAAVEGLTAMAVPSLALMGLSQEAIAASAALDKVSAEFGALSAAALEELAHAPEDDGFAQDIGTSLCLIAGLTPSWQAAQLLLLTPDKLAALRTIDPRNIPDLARRRATLLLNGKNLRNGTSCKAGVVLRNWIAELLRSGDAVAMGETVQARTSRQPHTSRRLHTSHKRRADKATAEAAATNVGEEIPSTSALSPMNVVKPVRQALPPLSSSSSVGKLPGLTPSAPIMRSVPVLRTPFVEGVTTSTAIKAAARQAVADAELSPINSPSGPSPSGPSPGIGGLSDRARDREPDDSDGKHSEMESPTDSLTPASPSQLADLPEMLSNITARSLRIGAIAAARLLLPTISQKELIATWAFNGNDTIPKELLAISGALCVLFNVKPGWTTARRIVACDGFIPVLVGLDVSDVSTSTVKVIHAVCVDQNLPTLALSLETPKVTRILSQWLVAFAGFYDEAAVASTASAVTGLLRSPGERFGQSTIGPQKQSDFLMSLRVLLASTSPDFDVLTAALARHD